MGKAASYTLSQWKKLERCFDYEEVELSNNLAENSMRPVAVGRKNWLHIGSVPAGPKVAAILSAVVVPAVGCASKGLSRFRTAGTVWPDHARSRSSHPGSLGRHPLPGPWVGLTVTNLRWSRLPAAEPS